MDKDTRVMGDLGHPQCGRSFRILVILQIVALEVRTSRHPVTPAQAIPLLLMASGILVGHHHTQVHLKLTDINPGALLMTSHHVFTTRVHEEDRHALL